MTITINAQGAERKRLVQTIAQWLGCEAKYLGVPSCAYQVDCFTIDRNGSLSFDDHADSEVIERLLEHTELQRGDSVMKENILSVIRLVATPVLLMVLGLILLIHPDSASALVAQILGWGLLIAGVVFAVSAIAGHFDTVGKVLSAVCCFAVGAWLLRNPLMLAAGLGRLAGILLVVRGVQDILNASRYHYGILPAVITTVLGAVLIALPMATSRFVMSLCGLLVLIVGVAILVDRLKNRRPKEPSESDIIDAL